MTTARRSSHLSTPWLGARRGYLSDWVTQRWVQWTGRRLPLQEAAWLDGPIGSVSGIGGDFFEEYARAHGLKISQSQGQDGLFDNFGLLASDTCDPVQVSPQVVDFYEHTARYEMDAWAEWQGAFRPFGALLAFIFSRRLQQLNVPLSSLDTSRGITNEVLQIQDQTTGELHYTAWVRKLVGAGDLLYAGAYSFCRPPRYPSKCVKVVFPLPNGNGIVIMQPTTAPDGSFTLTSSGSGFGDAGFYFTVHHGDGTISVRYLRTLRESIRVYSDEANVRADHVLTLLGFTFLKLHYRLSPKR